jgi:hypothetical protein
VFRIAPLALALAAVTCTGAGLAYAAERPAQVSPPAGARQLVLRPQAFHVVDAPPKGARAGAASPGDTAIITYRVLAPADGHRLGRAQFVCVVTDRGGAHQQCSGTIALPDGQLATQGDPDHVTIAGGTGAYAGARGTATGRDHPHRVDVTLHLLA